MDRRLIFEVSVREETGGPEVRLLCQHQEVYAGENGWNLDDPRLRESLERHAGLAFDEARDAIVEDA
jgi:hypothetical protein